MVDDIVSRNNVRTFGKGTQPMLFAHGFGCDQNMWRFITPAFEQDYKIVLFDYVGAENLTFRNIIRTGTLSSRDMHKTYWMSAKH